MISGIFYCDIQFFRFYRDGILLDVLIKGNCDSIKYKELNHWFKREQVINGVLEGRYKFQNNMISFSTLGHFGNGRLTNYEGIYKKDKLILSSLNHNTGRRIEKQIFIRLE